MKALLHNIYSVTIRVFGIVILAFLTYIGIFSTCVMTRTNEYSRYRTMFLSSSIIKNTLLPVLFLVSLFFIRKSKIFKDAVQRINDDSALFNKIHTILLIILGSIAFLWVLSTQYIPTSDQLWLETFAEGLHAKNYAPFEFDEYLGFFPFQMGLIVVEYLLSFVFGEQNYLVFQFLNVAALVLLYHQLSGICKELGFSNVIRLLTIVLGILFFPLIMYCSYVYGTILGLAFSVTAVHMLILFFRNPGIKPAVLCLASILAAILFKSNYQIFLIAIIIASILEFIRNKGYKTVLMIGMLILVFVAQSYFPYCSSRFLTDEVLTEGLSTWGYIATGLLESNRAPGGYNDYCYLSYQESGFDSTVHAELSKQKVKEAIAGFAENPKEARRFFTQKLAAEWNEPTFWAYWNFRGKDSQIKPSALVNSFMSVKGEAAVHGWLEFFRNIIVLGGLLYCILSKGSKEKYELILVLAFIGGFICYTIWEGGSRYTIPFFVLLFPYSLQGINELLGVIEKRTEKRKETVSWLVAAVGVMIALSVFYGGNPGNLLCTDDGGYSAYLDDNSGNGHVGTEYCYLKNAQGVYLNLFEDYMDLSEGKISVVSAFYNGQYYFRGTQGYGYLTAGSENEHDIALEGYGSNKTQGWDLLEAGDGGYYIKNPYGVLTYDSSSDRVYLDEFSGTEGQVWYLE